MIIQQYVEFLAELEKNNNRIWFDHNRARFDILRENITVWFDSILEQMIDIDSLLQTQIAKKCLYRINRDVRFSKNKSPYKTTFSALISATGKTNNCIGYYCQIDSQNRLVVGGGQYVLEPNELFRIRLKLSKDPSKLQAIIANYEFQQTYRTLSGEQLKTCPKGFSKLDPNLELLRYKNYTASKDFSVLGLSDVKIAEIVVDNMKVLLPLIEWLRSV